MLVDVVGFLGSEVVLSPVVSGCLPSCGGRVLVGVVGFLGSEVVLSPVVSGCPPFMWIGVASILGLVWSASWALKWSCLPLSSGCLPSCGGRVFSLHVGGGCWLVWSASWALKWSCLPLSPVVSLHVGGGCCLVWPHLQQKHSEIKITGFNLNLLTVNCLGSTLV